ncbi:MAG: hypothetical protein AAB660_02860 [Patescibacteria group bacterium]
MEGSELEGASIRNFEKGEKVRVWSDSQGKMEEVGWEFGFVVPEGGKAIVQNRAKDRVKEVSLDDLRKWNS